MGRILDLDDLLKDDEPTLEEARKEIAQEQHPPQQFRDKGNGE